MCLVWLVWLVWCDWCGSPLCEVPQSVDNWLVWRGGHSWSAGRPHTRARDQVGPGQGSVTSGEVPLPPSSPPPVSRHWGPCREGSRDRAGLFLPCHQIHGTSSVDTPSHLDYYIYGPPTPSHLHHQIIIIIILLYYFPPYYLPQWLLLTSWGPGFTNSVNKEHPGLNEA